MTVLNLSGAELLKKLAVGGGLSAGAVVAYELIELVKKDPKLIEAVLNWGPLFAALVIVLLLVDRRGAGIVDGLTANAVAQQKIADAMQKIAEKDDRQAEELRTLTSYNAVQSDKLLTRLDAIGQAVNESAATNYKNSSQLSRHEFWLAQISEVLKTKMGAPVAVPESGGDKAMGARA